MRTAAGAAVAFALVGLVGWFDYFTGRSVVLGSFYFIPIAAAAWFGGPGAAVAAALLSTAAAFIVNHALPGQPFSFPAAIYWDDAARLVLFSLAGIALAKLRELQSGLRWTVDRRAEELRHVNEELQEVGYAVAHSLRAPLRTIARHGGRDPRVREAVERTERLIDGLLTLTRVAARELQRRDVDLAALAREEASAFPGLAFDAPRGLRARCDPELARALLRALLDNAWKFTRGKPGARVRLMEPRPGVFVVEDEGEGFDSAYSSRLFEPFQTLHPAGRAGTGVGLPLARRIVKRHGGRIWAEGEPGRGARFWFTLERHPQAARWPRPGAARPS